jgi:hypothetical protein
MDASLSTPLLDAFRRGDVPHEVRMLAARGVLAPRAHEQLALLMILTEDADAEVAATADATVRAIPAGPLAGFLARSDVPESMRAFFTARGIAPAVSGSGTAEGPIVGADDGEDTAGEAEPNVPLAQRIAAMTVAQRVVRALKGSREERAILIRDSSKLVSVSVLSSPKITESEIELIVRMTNVSEEVLRIIGRTRAWMKNYSVMAGLAKNPKTPLAMSLNLLPHLIDKDVRSISTDRNVPEVLRTTARRKVAGK